MKIKIKQGSVIIDNIKSLEFSSDITELCHTVNFSFPLNFEEIIKPYEKITVWLDNTLLFTGWIDELSHSESNICQVVARSLPSVLVDSQIYLDKVEINESFYQFVGRVCNRFELDFNIPDGHRARTIKSEKISYAPDDKAFRVLDELAIKHSLLLGSDNHGRLIVRDLKKNDGETKKLNYIKNISYKTDLKNVFRNYQGKRDDKIFSVRNNEVKKINYFIKTKFEEKENDTTINEYLNYEMSVGKMASERVGCTIPYSGELVREGDFVIINNDKFLVSDVSLSVGDAGSTQDLGLVHPETFSTTENRIILAYKRLRRLRAKERKQAEQQRLIDASIGKEETVARAARGGL